MHVLSSSKTHSVMACIHRGQDSEESITGTNQITDKSREVYSRPCNWCSIETYI